ncbi:hypothetical protein BOTBODRAFT_52519 [Botryobasidium botryosum FD-172 SS1]|uniref:F-box domain-containing protein n=1 Tax=Botryobasidium botryosum (strain FD-172 SS1) TaxID=930990 RepID=A0A067MUZ5_BOTB1|nr:hypothetical protein BOTBODRAFT_52519 [Botryobasidium botryosum FD-172 SS1]
MILVSVSSRLSKAAGLKFRQERAAARSLVLELPPEVVTCVLDFVDQLTLAAVARTCRSLRANAERLLYRNVFISDVPHLHTLAKALVGSANGHRSLALRRLTIVYARTTSSRAPHASHAGGLTAIKDILHHASNLLHFAIWKPGLPHPQPWFQRVFRRPIDHNAMLFQLEARSEHNRYCEDSHPSVRSFKASGTLALGESAEILRTFLSSTAPLPSLAIEVWYRSPEILTVIPEQLPSLQNLEILDPDPYAYLLDATTPRRYPQYFLEPIITQLPSLENFKLRGGWMTWSTQSGHQMVNAWGKRCPALRHVKLDWGAEWIRAEEGWRRQSIEPLPLLVF